VNKPKSEITVTIDCAAYMNGSILDAIENKLVASLEEHISDKVNKAVEQRILKSSFPKRSRRRTLTGNLPDRRPHCAKCF
jgi:hypothetical protein